MKKVILAMLSVALTTIAFALENVTIRTTYVDGKVTYDTQKFKKQNGGFYRVHIPVDKIKRHMAHIDIIADDAVATKGEHGFWVMGNGASGEFNKDRTSGGKITFIRSGLCARDLGIFFIIKSFKEFGICQNWSN